jgi:hypothetical protein
VLGFRGKNFSNGIDYAMYKDAFAFYAFRLSPVDPESGSFDFKRSGTTSIRIELNKPAAEPLGLEVHNFYSDKCFFYFRRLHFASTMRFTISTSRAI